MASANEPHVDSDTKKPIGRPRDEFTFSHYSPPSVPEGKVCRMTLCRYCGTSSSYQVGRMRKHLSKCDGFRDAINPLLYTEFMITHNFSTERKIVAAHGERYRLNNICALKNKDPNYSHNQAEIESFMNSELSDDGTCRVSATKRRVFDRGDEVDVNVRPRRRLKHLPDPCPLDLNLIGGPILTKLQSISLSDLLKDGVEHSDLNMNYIDAQIMRVIMPGASLDGKINTAFMVRSKPRSVKDEKEQEIKFTRLFLMRMISTNTENERLFYMIEARNTNSNLWNRDVDLLANGSITIGTVVRIPAPLPIQYVMCSGNIPMVETRFPLIAMRHPRRGFEKVPVNMGIQGNSHLAFVQHGAYVAVNRTSPEETTCQGLFCDKQRINDWLGLKGCGCYYMGHSKIALVHSISVEAGPNCSFSMLNFSSMKFSKLYLNNLIPSWVKIWDLQMTDDYFNLLESIGNVMNIINDNGGFTVVGWYTRGEVHDNDLVASNTVIGRKNNNDDDDDEESFASDDELNYHVIELLPTKREFLDPSTTLGLLLGQTKFDVSKIRAARSKKNPVSEAAHNVDQEQVPHDADQDQAPSDIDEEEDEI